MSLEFRFSVEGDFGIRTGYRGLGRGSKDREADAEIRAWLHTVGEEAQIAMIRHAPYDTGALVEHINEGRVNRLAGGNFYSVSVGIDPIPPKQEGESPEYPRYVAFGTGVYGEGHAMIFPTHGNVIAFQKSTGETVFTRFVHGQKPNRFLEEAYHDTEKYIAATKHELAAALAEIYAS